MTRLATRVVEKDSLLTPGTNLRANWRTMALTMSVNKPKLRMLIGKVSSIKTGLTNRLSRLMMRTKTKALEKEETRNPGTR